MPAAANVWETTLMPAANCVMFVRRWPMVKQAVKMVNAKLLVAIVVINFALVILAKSVAEPPIANQVICVVKEFALMVELAAIVVVAV